MREEVDVHRAMSVQDRARQKAEEYERNCGAVWREYRACLQVGVWSIWGSSGPCF